MTEQYGYTQQREYQQPFRTVEPLLKLKLQESELVHSTEKCANIAFLYAGHD